MSGPSPAVRRHPVEGVLERLLEDVVHRHVLRQRDDRVVNPREEILVDARLRRRRHEDELEVRRVRRQLADAREDDVRLGAALVHLVDDDARVPRQRGEAERLDLLERDPDRREDELRVLVRARVLADVVADDAAA